MTAVHRQSTPSTRSSRLQFETDALARVTAYQYDAASNLSQRTDARGLVTKYFPDDANRLDLIEHWNGQTLVDSVDYAYNAVGFRTQMTDATGTTTYTPDALNRPTNVTFPGPKTVGYQYDDLPGGSAADYPGQRTKITYPDSKTASYTYLADGSMSTATDWLTKVTTYTYDNAGGLTKTQLPNTAWTDFTYDNADRLTSAVNKRPGPVTISSFTYTLDKAGNRTQMADLSGTHSYQYDPLYRLNQVTYPGPTTDTYTYDAVGNRLTKNATTNTYDAADQMLTAGAVSYGYDLNGNQTSRGSDIFDYDHENRLTKIRIGGGDLNPCYDVSGDGVVDVTDSSTISGYFGTSEPFYDLNGDGFVDISDINMVAGQFNKMCPSRFTYNGDGLRVARAGSYLNWKYVWDVAAGLPEILKETDSHNEEDGHGTDNTYVYGLDLISVTDRAGAQSYFLYDGLGSTTDLTDGSGNSTAGYGYDVFGAIRSQTGSSPNEFKFTGEQRDPQLNRNLYYLRARYYDPASGRFLTQDPFQGLSVSPQSLNRYTYVANSPVNRVDPRGLENEGGGPFLSVCKGVTPLGCTGYANYPCIGGVPQTCQPPGASSSGLFKTIFQALTSECAQGIAAAFAAGALIGGSVVSGAVIIQSGALVTTSAGALATSAAGVSAYAFAPVPSDTILGIGKYSYAAIKGIGECY